MRAEPGDTLLSDVAETIAALEIQAAIVDDDEAATALDRVRCMPYLVETPDLPKVKP